MARRIPRMLTSPRNPGQKFSSPLSSTLSLQMAWSVGATYQTWMRRVGWQGKCPSGLDNRGSSSSYLLRKKDTPKKTYWPKILDAGEVLKILTTTKSTKRKRRQEGITNNHQAHVHCRRKTCQRRHIAQKSLMPAKFPRSWPRQSLQKENEDKNA